MLSEWENNKLPIQLYIVCEKLCSSFFQFSSSSSNSSSQSLLTSLNHSRKMPLFNFETIISPSKISYTQKHTLKCTYIQHSLSFSSFTLGTFLFVQCSFHANQHLPSLRPHFPLKRFSFSLALLSLDWRSALMCLWQNEFKQMNNFSHSRPIFDSRFVVVFFLFLLFKSSICSPCLFYSNSSQSFQV